MPCQKYFLSLKKNPKKIKLDSCSANENDTDRVNESETDSASESEFEAQFKEISVQTNNPSVCTTSTQKDPSVCSKSTQKDCYCQLINCFAAQHVEKDFWKTLQQV